MSSSSGILLKVPITYTELKLQIRSNGIVNHQRSIWWIVISNLNIPISEEKSKIIDNIPDIDEIAKNLDNLYSNSKKASFVESLESTIYTSDSIKSSNEQEESFANLLEIVISLVNTRKLVYDIKLLVSLIDILLTSKVFDDVNRLFLLISNIASSEDKFISSTYENHMRKILAFRHILSIHLPKTFKKLLELGALEIEHLNLIFVRFFKDLFSFDVILNIIDSFLLQGYKILYRFGIALIKIHKKGIKNGTFKDGKEVWDFLRLKSITLTYSDISGIAYDLGKFQTTFWHPAYMKRSTINTILRDNRHLPKVIDSSVVATFGLKNETSIGQELTYLRIYVSLKSSILADNHDLKIQLIQMIPENYYDCSFESVFSSIIDGYDIKSLYLKTDSFSNHVNPYILLIKPMESACIIGCFKATSHASDKNTFLFRISLLDEELLNTVCYKKVQLTHSDSEGVISSYNIAVNQVAMFSKTYLAFGSSSSQGTNAIRIDNDLKNASCGFSDTFGNPPLFFDGNPFVIEAVEVLSLKY